MDSNLRELLYRSFDGALSDEEESTLEAALKASAPLREEKERLTALRAKVAAAGKLRFQPGFATKVMRKVNQLPQESDPAEHLLNAVLWAFKRIAIPGLVAATLLIGTIIMRSDSLDFDRFLGIPQTNISDVLELDDFSGELANE